MESQPQVMIGLAAGDMLGAPMEFMRREEVLAAYGEPAGPVARSRGAFAAGEFTDDTQMALCLLSAYPADEGLVARARAACQDWLAAGPRDVGVLTRQALRASGVRAWRDSGRRSCGNGALMRAAASVAAGRRGRAVIEDAVLLGAITHADPRSLLACAIYCGALRALVDGAGYVEAWEGAIAEAANLDPGPALATHFPDGTWLAEVQDLLPAARAEVEAAVRAGLRDGPAGNGGFALTTLRTAVARGRANSFPEGVLPVIREGDDADTVAAVTGAILAARGLAPPSAWLADLRSGGPGFAAWPGDERGSAAVERIRRACRLAALVSPAAARYPPGVPVFVARRLHPRVAYGRNPLFRDEVQGLKAAGITHVVDLREDREWRGLGRAGADAMESYMGLGIIHVNFPVPDGEAPNGRTFDGVAGLLEHVIAEGGTAFVHCRAGRERTGAALLAWWLARGGSLEGFREQGPELRPLPSQLAAARAWAARAR